jgi:hypothetical protein
VDFACLLGQCKEGFEGDGKKEGNDKKIIDVREIKGRKKGDGIKERQKDSRTRQKS